MIKQSFPVIIICLFVFSCKKHKSIVQRVRSDLSISITDTLKRSIPRQFKDTFYLKLFETRVKSLNLPLLKDGKADLEIRLWQDQNNNSGILYDFDFYNNKWKGKKCVYKFISKPEGEWLDSLSGNFTFLPEPKGGWESLMNKLLDKGIHKFKDYTLINGYFTSSDANGVIVEISLDNFYKCYELPLIKYQPIGVIEAQKMREILAIIESSF